MQSRHQDPWQGRLQIPRVFPLPKIMDFRKPEDRWIVAHLRGAGHKLKAVAHIAIDLGLLATQAIASNPCPTIPT
jgi:hypothetical protein